MCEPVTIAIVAAAGATTAGTVLSAQGQYETDKANEKVLEFQEKSSLQQSESEAAAFDSQADDEEFRARNAIKRGRFITNRFRRQVQGEIGETKAKLAITGVQVTSGSAQRILEDQTRAGASDEILLEQNNSLEVWGFKQRAQKFRQGAQRTRQAGRVQAELFSVQAKAIGEAADRKRTTTLLSGFGKTALLTAGAF